MKNIDTYRSWTRRSLKLDELYLDPSNIRLEIENKTQDAIIADLFVNEAAYEILKSIVEYGWLPDETPVVAKENGKYYVIEGNRRVSSLKAIANPKILPAPYDQKAEKLVKDLSPTLSIEVLEAPDRASTDRYLASKHTVNTRRPWTALRRAYFYYAQKEKGDSVETLIAKYPNTDIPKYIKMYEMHRAALSLETLPSEVKKKVENKRDFDISTLERLYDYKFVRQELGIDFDPITGEAKVPKSKGFHAVYSRIIEDITKKYITSRKRIDNEKNAREYLREILPQKIATEQKVKASDLVPKPAAKSPKRKPLFPKTLVCTIENAPGIERRLDELQRINYSEFEYASLDSLRSFLETIVKKYLGRIGQEPKKVGKYSFLEGALAKLKTLVEAENKTEIVQVIEFIQRDKLFLDAVNHNPSFIAKENEIKDLADRMIELILYIFKKYEDDSNKNT